MSTFNQDSIQTGDGNLAEPVHVGRPGQQVIFSSVDPVNSYAAKYPTIESVPEDFSGEVEIVTPTYRATVKGDGTTKYTVGVGPVSDRPSADVIGKGSWQDGNAIEYSDGVIYSPVKNLPVTAPIYANTNWAGWTNYTSGTSIINGSTIEVTSTGSAGNLYLARVASIVAPRMVKIRMRVTAGTLTTYRISTLEATGAATTGFATDNFVFSALNVWHEFYVDLKTTVATASEIDIVKATRAVGDKFEVSVFEIYGEDRYSDWSAHANGLAGALTTPEVITKKVAKSGGQFTTITAALAAITDASATKNYIVSVYPGQYDEINVTCKAFVDIIGKGDREECIINGYQIPSTSNALIAANSTMTFASNSKLKNLTILGKNVRYAIHNDALPIDTTQYIDNCYIEHLGNAEARADRIANSQDPALVHSSENGMGCGASSGLIQNITNSIIKGTNCGLQSHNNNNFSVQAIVNIESTEILSTSEAGTPYLTTPGASLRIDSVGSASKDKIRLKNCKLNGRIHHGDNGGAWTGTANPVTHTEWDLTLTGCGEIQYENSTLIANDAFQRAVNFDTEDALFNTSGGILARGTALAYNTANTNIRAMLSTDTVDKFIGIALTDIAIGALGRVSRNGIESDTFILADGVVTAALGTIYEVSSTTPGAFFVNAASTRAIARGIGVNILKY